MTDWPMLNLEHAGTMTTSEEPEWKRNRLRVPRENGTFLIEPDPEQLIRRLRQRLPRNDALASSSQSIFGRPLRAFADEARADALEAAKNWTEGILKRPAADFGTDSGPGTEATEPAADAPLIMTGHQPELFHPGVFAKNIAARYLAEQTGGVGLNLIVDNDLAKSFSIRVPAGERQSPRLSTIEFDEPRTAQPWETACLHNRELFESFGDRVSEAMAAWGIAPLISDMWPQAVECSRRPFPGRNCAPLAECLAAARIHREHAWGQGNLELPISRLCDSRFFRAFAAHIFVHASPFRETYNRVLAEYREVHRIRSTSHPVPALRSRDGWHETPFWLWHHHDTQRWPVFIRRGADGLDIAKAPEDSARLATLPVTERSDMAEVTAAFASLDRAGFRLRTRALTTTLYARLCLGDLFIHGIGGAKYDAMTDHIAAEFFEVRLPDFMTLTATLYLPSAEPHDVTSADAARLRQQLRDLKQNPQRHLPRDVPEEVRELVAEKENLIAEQHSKDSQEPADSSASAAPSVSGAASVAAGMSASASGPGPSDMSAATSGESRPENRSAGSVTGRKKSACDSRPGERRYRRIPEINRSLADWTAAQQEAIRAELSEVEERLRANEILRSREFSICLYPEEAVTSMIERLQNRLSQ